MQVTDDKKSNIFTNIVIVLIIIFICISFYKYIFKKDYLVEIKIPCDKKLNSCFIDECEDSDPRCFGSGKQLLYSVLYRKASDDSPIQNCGSSGKCEIIYCDNDNVKDFSNIGQCSEQTLTE